MRDTWRVLLAVSGLVICTSIVHAASTIGILRYDEKEPAAIARAVRRAVPDAKIVSVSVEQFANNRLPQQISLMVVPDAHRLPVPVGTALEGWFRKGKGVLFVSESPPMQQWLYRTGNRWVERREALLELARWRPLWRGLHPAASAWRRSTDAPDIPASWTLVDSPHGKAWQIRVDRLAGWCTFDVGVDNAFTEGETLLSFWAKGDPHTRAISIEWREKDGSRWVATVPLSTEWQRVVLEPRSFAYWPDNPSKGRGGAGDSLQPQNATELSIGLARSFASYPNGIPLQATLADLRVGKLSQLLPAAPSLTLEGVAPHYKFYTDSRGRWRSVMRYRGVGIGGESPGRRIVTPLADRACVFVSARGHTKGSLWGWISPADATVTNLSAVLRPMLRGWHLLRAGTIQFGFWQDERVVLGAEVANWRSQPVSLRLEARLTAVGQRSVSQTISVTLTPGETRRVLFPEMQLPKGEWRIRVSAVAQDGTSDANEHPFYVLGNPAKIAPITVRSGRFYWGDKPFYAHGINFWPPWIAGQERSEFWQHWLSPGQYDPEELERALRIAKKAGFNVLSVQYLDVAQAPQLVDFMERARRLGLYINLFIAAAHPFGFERERLRALIEDARLPLWSNIFAYDIAWEPFWGAHAERKRFDAQWREWIAEQYGSVENAERDWGYPAPRADGAVTNPTDEQILNDGEWRRMVAAYRRFQDDLVNRAYWRVVRFIRQLDPHHLIGVRTGYGGNGNPWVDFRMPYDLLAGAPFLDFISPEGYSLTDNWENFRAGGFITAYARWAGNGKPVFWAEFGASIYPNTTPQRIQYQRDVYEWMYRMVEESCADGSAAWWFPGGLRVDENSDYGIIHPDGTLRPAAQTAQVWRERLSQIPVRNDTRETLAIVVDRDLHPRGFSQVWARHRQEYLAAVQAGKRVEIRTVGTGTTSESVPLVAVGNVSCNGNNPPKYLNAQILQVEAVDENGKAVEVEPNLPLPTNTVRLRVTVMNTGEATWLPPGKRRVELAASWGERRAVEQPVARYATTVFEIPFVAVQFSGRPQPATIRLQLVTEMEMVIPFGERRVLVTKTDGS